MSLLSRAGFERLVAAGILAVAAIATLAVLASSWASWSAVSRAAKVAARGQAEILMADAQRTVLPQSGDGGGAQAATRRFLEAQSANGARYFALLDPIDPIGSAGVLLAQAGTAPMPLEQMQRALQAAPMGELVPVGQLLMMKTRPPMPSAPSPGSAAMMQPNLAPLLPGGAPPPQYLGLPQKPPELVLVFEPLVSRQLEAAANRTRLLGLVGALALLLATAVVLRWLRARAEMARRREHDGRLVVLGEMSAVLAHEIRNPLASLKGHAQLLVELVQPGRAHDKAERVVREAMRLEGLVNDLLEFVRSGRIERVPTDPAALLKSSAESVDASRLHVSTAGAPPMFSLDGPRLAQVLINVLRNAQQATPVEAPPVEADVRMEDGALVFTVHDHGPGVPPGEEERIFEPFHTTRVRGMGLGLAAARRLVALHGGTIRVANHAEGGAVFRIEIPRE